MQNIFVNSIYIIVSEIVIMVAIAIFIISRRSIKNNRMAGESESEGSSLDPLQRYLSCLLDEEQRTISEKRAMAGSDKTLDSVFSIRGGFLRLEKHAIENCQGDFRNLWGELRKGYKKFLVYQDQRVSGYIKKLDLCKVRIASLEKFKALFFDIKDKILSMKLVNDGLTREISRLVPADQRSAELERLLNEMQQEKSVIEGKLSDIEAELTIQAQAMYSDTVNITDTVAGNDAVNPGLAGGLNQTVERVGVSAEKVKALLKVQNAQIMELKAMAQQPASPARDDLIEKVVQRLEEKNFEMSNIISVLNEENEFMQSELDAAVVQGTNVEKYTSKIVKLRAELDEKDAAFMRLEEQYAVMEVQYLELFEKNK